MREEMKAHEPVELKKAPPEANMAEKLMRINAKLSDSDFCLAIIQKQLDGKEREIDKFPDPQCIDEDLEKIMFLAEVIFKRVSEIEEKFVG